MKQTSETVHLSMKPLNDKDGSHDMTHELLKTEITKSKSEPNVS